jgi:hypothetical protein
MPRLPGSAAVADRILLSPVQNQWQLDNHTVPHDVPRVWIPSFCHGWNNLPSNPPPLAGLVSSHMASDRPET